MGDIDAVARSIQHGLLDFTDPGSLHGTVLPPITFASYCAVMPLVEVTYRAGTPRTILRELAQCLPEAVSIAVACTEEPYEPPLEPGDVEIRFRELGPYDVSGMDVVVEVRSKWFPDRAEDRQQRCTLVRDLVSERTGVGMLGVYLTLPVAAWAQTSPAT